MTYFLLFHTINCSTKQIHIMSYHLFLLSSLSDLSHFTTLPAPLQQQVTDLINKLSLLSTQIHESHESHESSSFSPSDFLLFHPLPNALSKLVKLKIQWDRVMKAVLPFMDMGKRLLFQCKKMNSNRIDSVHHVIMDMMKEGRQWEDDEIVKMEIGRMQRRLSVQMELGQLRNDTIRWKGKPVKVFFFEKLLMESRDLFKLGVTLEVRVEEELTILLSVKKNCPLYETRTVFQKELIAQASTWQISDTPITLAVNFWIAQIHSLLERTRKFQENR